MNWKNERIKWIGTRYYEDLNFKYEWNKIMNKAYEQFLNGEKQTHKITWWNASLNWKIEKLT